MTPAIQQQQITNSQHGFRSINHAALLSFEAPRALLKAQFAIPYNQLKINKLSNELSSQFTHLTYNYIPVLFSSAEEERMGFFCAVKNPNTRNNQNNKKN